MPDALDCNHDGLVGECAQCGYRAPDDAEGALRPQDCSHELVLNGACFYCGESELDLSIKPRADAAQGLVTLKRRGDKPRS